MHSVKVEGLRLLRNGDLNLMHHYGSSSEFWSEFGGLHKHYDLELAKLPLGIADDFRDKMLFFGGCGEIKLEGIEARDNWFWEASSQEGGAFITAHNS